MPPPSNDDRETFDEWVAVVFAVVVIGGVLFWGIGRQVNWRTAFSDSIVSPLEGETSERAIASITDELDADEENRLDRFRRQQELDAVIQDDEEGGVIAAHTMAPLILALPDPSTMVSDTEPAAIADEQTTSDDPDTSELPETSSAIDAIPEEELDTAEDAADAIAEDELTTPSGESTAASESVTFVDVPDGYWAKPFIDKMAQLNVLQGVDGESFQPDEPITRAQYAALIAEVFTQSDRQISLPFGDLADDFWARPAIDAAVRTGFLSGYPGQVFRPDEPITRMQVLLSLNSGLELPPSARPADDVLDVYGDRQQIPEWAVPAIAATTEAQIVVSPEDDVTLSPDRPATRAEVISMVYQALVQQGEAESLDSPYVVMP